MKKMAWLAEFWLMTRTKTDIVFTKGNAIFLLHGDGRKERVLNESMIEQMFFVLA